MSTFDIDSYAWCVRRHGSNACGLVLVVAFAAASAIAQPTASTKSGSVEPSSPAQTDSLTGTKYKADSDMRRVLEAIARSGGKPIETLDAQQARRQPTPADAVKAVLKEQGKVSTPETLVSGVHSADRSIPGPSAVLPARVYTPDGPGPFPLIVYYHGGGWVIADKDVYDGGARGLAKQAHAVVLSVDYRRAPEAKFPAQHEDALATYEWAAQNAASIGADPKRIALAGESAGGNLALATAIAARDRKLTRPLHVLAVYPITQATNLSTPSYRDSATAKPLNKAMMAWFADNALTDAAKLDPRVNLLDADLAGLPPVTLINAQIDPLRSDGDLMEAALKRAKVPVEHKIYAGVTHEFFGMAAVVSDARDAQEYAGHRLHEAFERKDR